MCRLQSRCKGHGVDMEQRFQFILFMDLAALKFVVILFVQNDVHSIYRYQASTNQTSMKCVKSFAPCVQTSLYFFSLAYIHELHNHLDQGMCVYQRPDVLGRILADNIHCIFLIFGIFCRKNQASFDQEKKRLKKSLSPWSNPSTTMKVNFLMNQYALCC